MLLRQCILLSRCLPQRTRSWPSPSASRMFFSCRSVTQPQWRQTNDVLPCTSTTAGREKKSQSHAVFNDYASPNPTDQSIQATHRRRAAACPCRSLCQHMASAPCNQSAPSGHTLCDTPLPAGSLAIVSLFTASSSCAAAAVLKANVNRTGRCESGTNDEVVV